MVKRMSLVIFSILFLGPIVWADTFEAALCRSLFAQSQPFHYPAILNSLAPNVPHTIQNMKDYLERKLGKQVVESATDPRTTYQILLGPARKKLPELAANGIVHSQTIENPFGALNVVRLVKKDGSEIFVFTNINGESRYMQLMSFLKLVGIPESKINVDGYLTSYKNIYKKTFEKIGPKPDLVVFGFANTAVQALAEASDRTIWSNVMDNNIKYAEKKWKKPDSFEHELANMGIQEMVFEGNKKVWFIDNEYGDRAAVIARSLREYYGDSFLTLVLGTGGALNSKYKVGDIVSPKFTLTNGDIRTPLNSLGELISKEGDHVHVDSPGLETKAWLHQQIASKADFVDVELQKIANELQGTKFDTYLVISDVLFSNTPSDYTQWSENHRQELKQKLFPILEHFLKKVGILNLEMLQKYNIQKFAVTEDEHP